MPAAKQPTAKQIAAEVAKQVNRQSASTGGLVRTPRGLRATSVLGISGKESFLSALVTGVGGIAGAAVPLSRPPGDDLWWTAIPGAIALFATMQGSGELQHFAEGYLGGTGGYLATRILQRITFPTAAGYVQAAQIQAAAVHARLGVA